VRKKHEKCVGITKKHKKARKKNIFHFSCHELSLCRAAKDVRGTFNNLIFLLLQNTRGMI
jgi:hypothetical protein